MTQAWKQKSVGEILQLEYGKPLERSDRKPEGQFPVYGANGEKDRTDKFYHDKPSIIVGRKGSAGEINLTEKKFWPLDVTYFVTFDEKQHDLQFLFYLLKTLELTKLAKGVKPGINRNEVYSQTTRVPPLAEQQQLAGLLDEAFDGIAAAKANAEKSLQNAHALFESHLQSVFTQRGLGWMEKRIEEWCDSIMDCVNKTAPVVEGPTPFKMIRTTNVRNGSVDILSVRFVTAETYKIWTRRQVPQKGDVILTREAPMGEVGMLLTDDKVFLGQRLVSYRANSAKLDNEFLLFALQSSDLQGQIHAKASGSTVQHMRVPDTKNLVLAAPPLTKQRQIVQQLKGLREETQRLAHTYERKIAALGELKKSLLHQAFSGKFKKDTDTATIAPFPIRLTELSTTDLHAGILAIAFDAHDRNGKLVNFGHVKAEKFAHMVESYIGLDLGRAPVKDAAGPNDFPHLHKVEHRARMAGFFDFKPVDGAGYQVQKLPHFDALIAKTRMALADRAQGIDALLELMVPMSTLQAEIFSTVYAAWNNLLLDNSAVTEDEIVTEARENWHAAKLAIPREKFVAAIDWLGRKNMVPTGKGKRVEAKRTT